MIRVDALWLSVAPLDMRAGMDTLLAQVVRVFGEARPHHAYLFANQRGTRMKVLIHDGQGICQMRRIGEDVAEKLDYTPGTFSVERHIRGKWACAQCETKSLPALEPCGNGGTIGAG